VTSVDVVMLIGVASSRPPAEAGRQAYI
jgi:hypothetical protein